MKEFTSYAVIDAADEGIGKPTTSNVSDMTEVSSVPTSYPASMGQRTVQTITALACIASLLLVVAYLGYRHNTELTPVSQVQVSITAADVEPLTNAEWQTLELPWRLCPVRENPCYEHIRVNLPVSSEAQALYLPGYKGALRVRVNNVVLAEFGSLAPPIESILFRPSYVLIPAPLLQQTENQLLITVAADRRNYLRLNPFFIGSVGELQPVYAMAQWLSVDLLVASTGIYIVLGFLALLTYRLARQNLLFPWFAAIAFCAAARNSFFLWTDPNFDLLRGYVYFQASLGQLAAIVGFTGTLIGVARNRLFLYLVGATVVTSLAFTGLIAWDNYEGSHLATFATQGLTLLAGIWALLMLARYQMSGWHFIKPWVFALFAAAFILVIHDIAPAWLRIPIDHQLSNLAPLCLVVAFCFILAQQFSSALARVQAHNVELAQAVSKREQDLHGAYATIRRAERDQAVEAERVRILQDVHDGVGGRLAGLVLLARRRGDAEMAGHIQESLADLRLIIDSLDDDLTNDFNEAMHLFQSRAHQMLAEHGITAHWDISLAAGLSITPTWLVSVLRALQEMLHNVVKHAQADNVSISAEFVDDAIRMTVTDDGVGTEHLDDVFSKGRGLSNLKQRIEGLGGHIHFRSAASGTNIDLVIPLPDIPHESGGTDFD